MTTKLSFQSPKDLIIDEQNVIEAIREKIKAVDDKLIFLQKRVVFMSESSNSLFA